jgi:2'-5' RNA ligase
MRDDHRMPSREDSFYTQRWHDLTKLAQMRDHWWWRPGWHVGRSFYTWHVTFEKSPEVADLAAYYQQRITLPTLDPVPAEGLHMTLQGIGFTDDVTAEDVDAITRHAQNRCGRLAPFALTLGPVDADPEGAPLRVKPWAPVEQLRHALRASIADVWGPNRVPEAADQFFPHVTVFYSNAAADPAALRAALAALRGTPPVTTTVNAVSLIRLDRDEKVYRWNTIASVPLTGVGAHEPTPSDLLS